MAFVEQVVDQMNLLVFSAGSNPALASAKIEQHVIPPQLWNAMPGQQPSDKENPLWEAIVIFKALWPSVPPLVEFEHGQFAVGPGSRSSAFSARNGTELPRGRMQSNPPRSRMGSTPSRIERMIAEAKRARREM